MLQIRTHEVEQYWEKVILPERINLELQRWNATQEQLIALKIKEVEEYWEKTVLPERLKEWEITHTSLASSQQSITVSSATYTAADLDRILVEEHQKWQVQSEN